MATTTTTTTTTTTSGGGGGRRVGPHRLRRRQRLSTMPEVAQRRLRLPGGDRRVGGGIAGIGAGVGLAPVFLFVQLIIVSCLLLAAPASASAPPAFAVALRRSGVAGAASSSPSVSPSSFGTSFLPPRGLWRGTTVGTALSMSYVADSSDYAGANKPASDSVDPAADGAEKDSSSEGYAPGYREMADVPTIEESPTPLSKNAGMRFVAFVWDRLLDDEGGRDREELHDRRCGLVEDHVLWARKANLYNETWNWEGSNADVVWSYPLLSADKRYQIGQAICIDSNSVEHVRDLLSDEPVIRSLSSGLGDLSNVHLYRWMHIKDHSLRQDDGRTGTPTLILNLDRTDTTAVEGLRETTNVSHVEYLIDSERVVMAGPLHDVDADGDADGGLGPAVGSIVVINAEDREDAVRFAENDPCALAGLYETIRVHHFNDLDVSGKFVLRDEFEGDGISSDVVRATMEAEGYPVGDRQTPWINR